MMAAISPYFPTDGPSPPPQPQLEPTRLTDLPEELLVRVLAGPLLSSSTTLRSILHCGNVSLLGAVPPALNNELNTSQLLQIPPNNDELILLLAASLRVLRLHPDTNYHPVPKSAYGLLLAAPALAEVDGRANLPLLTLLPRQALSLQTLHLDVPSVQLFPRVLTALQCLTQLGTLGLKFSTDYSQTELPLARRCACAPLRVHYEPRNVDNVVALATAAPLVTSFSLECGCFASVEATVPPFPALRGLALFGNLPSSAPTHLATTAATLQSLTLGHSPREELISLVESLMGNVTGIRCNTTAVSRRLSLSDLSRLHQAVAVDGLSELDVMLHRDAEAGLPPLASRLERLVVSYREAKPYSILGLPVGTFHPMSPLALAGSLISHRLSHLAFRNASLDFRVLASGLRRVGGSLRVLDLAVHSQQTPLDESVTLLSDAIREGCQKLELLVVSAVPLDDRSFSAARASCLANKEKAARLGRNLDGLLRCMPYLNVSQELCDAVDRVLTPCDSGTTDCGPDSSN